MFFQETILKMILKYPFSFQSPAKFDALSDEVNDPWAHGAPAPDDGSIAEDVLGVLQVAVSWHLSVSAFR
jgi:hypothetical protein